MGAANCRRLDKEHLEKPMQANKGIAKILSSHMDANQNLIVQASIQSSCSFRTVDLDRSSYENFSEDSTLNLQVKRPEKKKNRRFKNSDIDLLGQTKQQWSAKSCKIFLIYHHQIIFLTKLAKNLSSLSSFQSCRQINFPLIQGFFHFSKWLFLNTYKSN